MPSTYQELIVWQKSIDLAIEVYAITARFPSSERFGLIDQSRRAATSIPSNIAEGYGRFSRADCRRFLLTARGSLFELETHFEIAGRLKYVHPETLARLTAQLAEVGKLLNGYIAFVESRNKTR